MLILNQKFWLRSFFFILVGETNFCSDKYNLNYKSYINIYINKGQVMISNMNWVD